MKPLNTDKTILLDEENRKIIFLGDPTKDDFEIPYNQQWDLFMLLVSANGAECATVCLENELHAHNPSDMSTDSPIKGFVSSLRRDLNRIGIPCNSGNEEDPDKITIKNRRNRGIGRNTGSYCLLIPSPEKRNEKQIADLFWKRYEYLSAQKEGQNKQLEINAKLGEVYQIPLMQKDGEDCEWSIETHDGYSQNILIEAPNGYGKTTLVKSILLSSICGYRNDLSEEEKTKYLEIKDFHNISDDYFCLFIECKNIDFTNKDNNDKKDDKEWIYDCMSNPKSIGIDKYIDGESFNELLKKYNLSKRLIIIIDGFDEIKENYRELLLSKIKDFQKDSDYGLHSKIILTTRPLFWNIDFDGYGYRKYSISNRNILEDRNVFMNYVNSYSFHHNNVDTGLLFEYVSNNYYLSKIICVPAIIVWIIREQQMKSETLLTVERIIGQMMLRYNSTELFVHTEQYKRVYEEIAYKYLCLNSDDTGLSILNTEIISFVRSCIDDITQEGNRRFNKIFSPEKTDDENLGEVFFTNVALMEFENQKLKFTSDVFAYHLAARSILRLFRRRIGEPNLNGKLNALPIKYRYYVMVLASSLAEYLTDNRFFEDFGSYDIDSKDKVAKEFFNYINGRLSSSDCNEKERIYIKEMLVHIKNKYYGENVYTDRNINIDISLLMEQ